MKNIKFYNFCRTAFNLIAAGVVFWIILVNCVVTASVFYDGSEKSTNAYSLASTIVSAVLFILCTAAAVLLKKHIKAIDTKKLFRLFVVYYAVCALYLILNASSDIRADAFWTYDAARHILDGNLIDVQLEGYIHRYPHQTGLMLYDQLLMLFSRNTQFNFTVNFLFVIGINYFIYKTADFIFKDDYTNIITIILTFAFLPQLFFILFAYGLIPGLFFTVLSFYYALKYIKDMRVSNFILSAVFIGIAVIFKQNFLIAGLAVIIYTVLEMIKQKKLKPAAFIAAVLVMMTLPGTFITAYYEHKTGGDLKQGTPAILWIDMGTDIDNYACGPGWYNGYNAWAYNVGGFNSENASELGKEKLSENIEKIKKRPADAVRFFSAKAISQWADPLYQSIWTGPLPRLNQQAQTELLNSLYSGGRIEQYLSVYMKFLSLVIWVFSAVFLVLYTKKYEGWEIMFLFMTGGFFFHIIWEGKSQYIYPYVICLIPFASFALRRFCTELSRRITAGKKRTEAVTDEE